MIGASDLVPSAAWRVQNAQVVQVTPYHLLGNAIIEQAVKDYRRALAVVNRYGGLVLWYQGTIDVLEIYLSSRCVELNDNAVREQVKERIAELRSAITGFYKSRKMLIECEEFFLSDWFSVLTKLDGRDLLNKLRRPKRSRQKPVV